MDRITRRHLDALAQQLNKLTSSPTASYTRQADGSLRANVGNFHISSSYGGYCLHRMANESGGITTPIYPAHVPARDLYERMRAFIAGIEFAREATSDAEPLTDERARQQIIAARFAKVEG